jgi:hypothetical protein
MQLSLQERHTMSKIALTPNASGTGVFTIASPATNTDRTLTLPDITGTLVSTDASGNVGIGTSSPSLGSNGTGLHIKSASGDYGVLKVDSSTTSEEGWVQFSNNGVDKFRIASDSSTNLKFIHSGVAERMCIDSSGNVIATSGSLNLVGTNTQMFASANGQDIQFKFSGVKKAQINNGGLISAGDGSEVVPSFRFTDDPNTGMFRATTDTLAFSTAGAERLRITSSGHLLVGTTTIVAPSSGHSFSVGNGAQQAIGHNGSSSGTYYSYYSYNGSVIGSITQSGTTSVAYNTSSDYRLKTDAQPMVGASDRVLALNPVNFEWISSGERVDGFLAHEAQEIVPECVTGTKDAMRDEEYEVTAAVYEDIIIAAVLDEEGNEIEAERTEQRLVSEAVMGTRSVPDMQGIDQSKLVPLLTAALQEALTKIEAMEIRLAALEAV